MYKKNDKKKATFYVHTPKFENTIDLLTSEGEGQKIGIIEKIGTVQYTNQDFCAM